MIVRLIAVAVLLTGCGAATPSDEDAPLDASEWLSIAVTEDGADRPLVDGTQIRLSFTDGQLGATAGCNSVGGPYRIEGGLLLFEGGGMTEMGCDDERHAQDDWLLGFLSSRPSMVVGDDKLTLTSGETVVTLQDSEVAEPDLPLTGTRWTVDSIISGDTVSSVPNGARATLTFTDDGRIEANTGCNTGSGSYEVSGASLRISEFFITLGGCDGPTAQLESALTAVIKPGQLEYAIDASSLTLMSGDQGLALRGD